MTIRKGVKMGLFMVCVMALSYIAIVACAVVYIADISRVLP